MPGDRPNARTGAKKPGDAGARGMAGATLGQHDPQRRAEIIPARSLANVPDQAKKLRWAEAGRDAVGQLTSGWPSGRAGSSPAPGIAQPRRTWVELVGLDKASEAIGATQSRAGD